MEILSREFILDTDLTNVDLGLPEEFYERVRDINGQMLSMADDITRYFYGDNPTPQQRVEGCILMTLAMRKVCSPEGTII
jgi:hypothetical protein